MTVSPLPPDSTEQLPPGGSALAQPVHRSPYALPFWYAYVANSFLMIAVTLLYRYSDFVDYLGGEEFHLGCIVGVGMIGSLAMRLFQGIGIDHYGPRRIWLLSLVLFVLSISGNMLVTRHDTAGIYLLRILLSISMAGAFGASITYVSMSMSVTRMAEVIGTLGTSGFLAMALGPSLGDLFRGGQTSRSSVERMFAVAAAMGLLSLLFAALATRGQVRPSPRRRPPLLWLLRKYHPGAVLLVSVAIGVGFAVPAVFLPNYVEQLGIGGIGAFFIVYALTAFMTRVLTRRLPERIGVKNMIYLGLLAMISSMLLYLLVTRQWHLAAPGFFGGIAHALLFPSVVASGTGAFPARFRGLGTTVMLSGIDFGTLIGAPLIGGLISYSEHFGLPPYPTMYITLAVLLTLVGLIYSVRTREPKALPSTPEIALAATGVENL